MRPLTRAAVVALAAAAVATGVSLRPADGSSPALRAAQTVLQASAAAEVQLAQVRADQATARAAARAAALARLGASRRLAAARHEAYLRAQATLTARKPPAPVVTPTATRAPLPSYPDRGTRLYRSLGYDVTRLGYRIVFRPYAAGLLGYTDVHTRTVTIYVRSRESDLVLRHSIAHEIGHVVDFARESAARHLLYLSVRQLSGDLSWYGCESCSDYQTPAGDWAEVFAQWLAGPGDFRSQLAGVPTSAQLALLAPLFRM